MHEGPLFLHAYLLVGRILLPTAPRRAEPQNLRLSNGEIPHHRKHQGDPLRVLVASLVHVGWLVGFMTAHVCQWMVKERLKLVGLCCLVGGGWGGCCLASGG